MSVSKPSRLPNVLLVGTGEYTTGLVNGQPSNSDKAAGIIGLTVFHLRHRGLTGPRIGLCGTSGKKLPMIRQHLQKQIGDKYKLDVSCDTFPADDVDRDAEAYLTAVKSFQKGDVAIVTTPDQTHFPIAAKLIEAGLHVLIGHTPHRLCIPSSPPILHPYSPFPSFSPSPLSLYSLCPVVAKPVVQTLADHDTLISLAASHGVLCAGELHKRWDPFYMDASDRISSGSLGQLTYYYAYMSQPKSQLSTFSAWINDKSTDISYYLNSHHIDFFCNAVTANVLQAFPTRVYAAASKGLADSFLTQHHPSKGEVYDLDDSITLTVTFQFTAPTPSTAIAVFTSCWTGPLNPDAHTQQTQHVVLHKGEIHVDQAHRGYYSTVDGKGAQSHNPLFFKYTQDKDGNFAGAGCYGYTSFEHFIVGAGRVNAGEPLERVKRSLVSVDSLAAVYNTAILEAGKKSLVEKRPVDLVHGKDGKIELH